MDPIFLSSHALMGLGLAMDAFSVSLADGLGEQTMGRKKACGIAFTFALFQGLMPLIGRGLVRGFLHRFLIFQPYIPMISLLLLLFLGRKMLRSGKKSPQKETEGGVLLFGSLLLQAIATSIDALSMGLTLSAYDLKSAFAAVGEIFTVTFFLCLAGIVLGKRFGVRLAHCASRLGGIILILIGLEIFILSLLKL